MRTTKKKVSSSVVTIIIGVLLVGGALVWLFAKGPKDASFLSALISSSGIHWHAMLKVTIDGKQINVPDDTGIQRQPEMALHTHAGEPNKIHMEFSSVVREDDLRLGKFFEVWGQPLSSTRLLDKTTAAGGTLSMVVNGAPNDQFDRYVMHDGDKIALTFTSPTKPASKK